MTHVDPGTRGEQEKPTPRECYDSPDGKHSFYDAHCDRCNAPVCEYCLAVKPGPR